MCAKSRKTDRTQGKDGEPVQKFIVVHLAVRPEEDAWVAKCLELGTVSEGDTEQEALDNIKEAVELYLAGLEHLGECERVLKQKGVTLHTLSRSMQPTVEAPIKAPRAYKVVRSAVYPVMCNATA